VIKSSPTAVQTRDQFRISSRARVQELAAWLPSRPEGLGRPATDRDAWERLRDQASAPAILQRAESYRATPPPELADDLYLEFTRTGNRSHYEAPYGLALSRIHHLALAECLEAEGRFVESLERDLNALCGHRTWVMPAHDAGLTNFEGTQVTIDLGSSARAWSLATILYWLGDSLAPEVCDRVRAEVRRRVLDPYLDAMREGGIRGNWWIKGTNNWNAVCNAGVVGAALALVDSAEERAEFVAGMELSLPYFISGFSEDGYCSEGMGYWAYGFGHYMMLGHMVRDATRGRLDLFADPKLQRIALYPIDIQIQPGIAPAFADCGVGARPDTATLALIDRAWPDLLPGRVRLTSSLSGGVIPTALHAFAPEPAESEPEFVAELPLQTWFPDACVLVSRSAPGTAPAFGIALKGGHNAEHHNHNDVGSFTLAVAGRPLLLDPGGEVYTRRTFSAQRYESDVLNSYGHPVPLVAGMRQSTGAQARAEVVDLALSDAADRLVLDLRQAYDVPELRELARVFEHDRAAGRMRLEDRVRFTAPREFETCLVTFDRIHRRAPDVFVVYNDVSALEVRVQARGGDWRYELVEIENPSRPTPRRMGFALTEPVVEAAMGFEMRTVPLAGDLPGVYIAPEWEVERRPDTDRALRVEAESFTDERGGRVEVCDKVGASGRSFRFWDDRDHDLTWLFEVPETGGYAVRVRYCHAAPGVVTREVLIDGEVSDAPACVFPATGGWSSERDDWQELWLTRGTAPLVVRLEAGQHRITLRNDCGHGLNLDWLELVPLP
jgi:hypothetical protein